MDTISIPPPSTVINHLSPHASSIPFTILLTPIFIFLFQTFLSPSYPFHIDTIDTIFLKNSFSKE